MRPTYNRPFLVLTALVVLLGIDDVARCGAGERRELPPSPWRAASASGLVESRSFVHMDGVEWHRVKRGDMLRSHSEVRTGKRGRTTLTRNADVLMVNPNSLVELPLEVVNDGEAPVMQRSGSVLYEIDDSVQRGFRVVTPYLVAGVKGTVFLITVENRYAAVTVEEGIVEVSDRSSGETVEVRAGETVIVEAELDGEMEVLRDLETKPTDKGSREMLKRARHEAELLDAVLEERAQGRAALETAFGFDQVIFLDDGPLYVGNLSGSLTEEDPTRSLLGDDNLLDSMDELEREADGPLGRLDPTPAQSPNDPTGVSTAEKDPQRSGLNPGSN